MAESTTVTAQATPISVTSTSTGETLGSELRTGEFTLGSGRLGTAETTQPTQPSPTVATPIAESTGGTLTQTAASSVLSDSLSNSISGFTTESTTTTFTVEPTRL